MYFITMSLNQHRFNYHIHTKPKVWMVRLLVGVNKAAPTFFFPCNSEMYIMYAICMMNEILYNVMYYTNMYKPCSCMQVLLEAMYNTCTYTQE